LDLIWVILDHPRRVIVGLSLVVKFGLDAIYSFGVMAIFIFRRFGLKLPIPAYLWVFPKNMATDRSNPKGPRKHVV